MNRLSLFAMLILTLVSASALAVEEHHSDQKPGATPPAGANDPAQASADETAPVERMKSNLEKMRQQLERIAQTKTPEERQKLLQEHMQTLRENMMMGRSLMMGGAGPAPGMGMMRDMGSGGMMGPRMMGMCPMMGMMGGGMMGGMGAMAPGMAPDAMTNRLQQMERRLDLMQMMMDQLLKSQGQPGRR